MESGSTRVLGVSPDQTIIGRVRLLPNRGEKCSAGASLSPIFSNELAIYNDYKPSYCFHDE